MAKTPRLRYHGIECTPEELDVLIDIAGYHGSPHGIRIPHTMPEDTWLPWAGEFVKPGGRAAASFKRHWAIDRGILKYDKIKKCNIWTALGAMYMRSVARGNPRLRRHGRMTAKFRRKKWRLEGLARKRGET